MNALCALPPLRRAQWLGILRALGHDVEVGPMLDPATGLPPEKGEEDVLCHASLNQHLPRDVVGELARITAAAKLPPLGGIASVGCCAEATLPLSCSPAALETCTGTVLLWAPMVSRRDGFQQNPNQVARDLLSYATARLSRSQKLDCVIVLAPQAAPGRSHWARWWPVESERVRTAWGT